MTCYENNQTSNGRSDSRRAGRAAGQNPAGSQSYASSTGDAGGSLETHGGAVGNRRGGNAIIRVHPRMPRAGRNRAFRFAYPGTSAQPGCAIENGRAETSGASTTKP